MDFLLNNLINSPDKESLHRFLCAHFINWKPNLDVDYLLCPALVFNIHLSPPFISRNRQCVATGGYRFLGYGGVFQIIP